MVCANYKAAHNAGVAPAVLGFDAPKGVIVSQFIDGTTLTNQALATDDGSLLTAFIGTSHPGAPKLPSFLESRGNTVSPGAQSRPL